MSRIVGSRKSSQNAELSSLFTLRVSKVSTFTGIRGVVVAKRRTVFTFGLVSGLHVSKVSTVTGIRGGRGREAQNCRHFWSRVFASQKCQQSQGSGGVVVAKRRTVVTFGLVSGLRISKVSTFTGIRVGRGRKAQNCRPFWTCLGFSRLKSVNIHRDPGGRGREAQNCLHFWTRLGSSRLKSVNSHRDPGGSWSQSAELSSLLALPLERGEERGERREEKREMRGKKRDERRERKERREEREERGERTEDRGQRREERGERRQERGERREETRERREDRGERREERGDRREERGERRQERGERRRERREERGERREERREERGEEG